MRIDLHTHSLCSDGTQPPAQVAASAAEAGLGALALTDHDTVAGWVEAREAALGLGLGFVPGLEISCRWSEISVHLLAYLVDPRDQPLFSAIEQARASRVTRMSRMVASMAADGVPVDEELVRAHVPQGAAMGRPHLADALVEAGVVRDRGEAFAGLLARESPYYVAYEAVDPVEAVRLVRAAGGVPVLAHPFARRRGEVLPDEVVISMAQAGLAALEADHRDHEQTEREHARALAGHLGLLATGASDYHGSGKPNQLGENTTDLETVLALLAQGSGAEALAPRGGWRD